MVNNMNQQVIDKLSAISIDNFGAKDAIERKKYDIAIKMLERQDKTIKELGHLLNINKMNKGANEA